MKQESRNEARTASVIRRRDLLGLIAVAAAAPLVSRMRDRFAIGGPTTEIHNFVPAAIVSGPSCVVRPQQTEGPYFADEKLDRSDIRSDPTDGSVKTGAKLQLIFGVSRMAGLACAPLSGAIVDVWQCDAMGVYSDFEDINGLFDTRGKKFLRGYQVTDKAGKAEFVTIYPGWYPGRTVHIHFKIRTNSVASRGHEFTSQLYFDESITDQVHALPPYVTKGRRTRKNNRDGIFQSGGDQLMLQLTKRADGYVGTFDIGLQLA